MLSKFVALTNLERCVQAEAALLKNDSKTVEKQSTASSSIMGRSQPKSGVQLSKEVNTEFLPAENIKNSMVAFDTRTEQSRNSVLCGTKMFLYFI